jgi:hypothetical protein
VSGVEFVWLLRTDFLAVADLLWLPADLFWRLADLFGRLAELVWLLGEFVWLSGVILWLLTGLFKATGDPVSPATVSFYLIGVSRLGRVNQIPV